MAPLQATSPGTPADLNDLRYEKVIPFSYDGGGDGKTDENLPPYYNYKTEDSGNTIAFSFSIRAGNEPFTT